MPVACSVSQVPRGGDTGIRGTLLPARPSAQTEEGYFALRQSSLHFAPPLGRRRISALALIFPQYLQTGTFVPFSRRENDRGAGGQGPRTGTPTTWAPSLDETGFDVSMGDDV